MATDNDLSSSRAKPDSPGGSCATLTGLLEALAGDREALADLVRDFLASCPEHLNSISAAVRAGNAQHLERSAHHFKGSLGIFCRNEPLALTQQLIDMGEHNDLTRAARTLELLEREMEQLVLSLEQYAGR